MFYTDPHHHHDSSFLDHVADHKRSTPAPATSSTGATHAASAAHPSHSTNASAAAHHTAGSSTSHAVALDLHQQQPRRHCIPRDFRRLWSPDERDELAKWRVDEARIERESQARERVYMAFEDAIAYIVNDRPRGFANDDDIDADDLVDDGQDDDDGADALASGADDASSNDSSPWGVLPPPRIEIAPNVVTKPECPHGDVVHGAMASLFRIVEQLYDTWTSVDSSPASDESAAPPFLWQAIYPQDAAGSPVYNPSGKYAVKLFVLGKWRRVDIDDRLPVDDADNAIVYVTSSMRSEIWPALLTKALLKVLHWLYGAGLGLDESDSAQERAVSPPIRVVNTVISALTGWKVSPWMPSPSPTAAREPMLQQLLEVRAMDGSSRLLATTEDSESLTMICSLALCPTSSSPPRTRQTRALMQTATQASRSTMRQPVRPQRRRHKLQLSTSCERSSARRLRATLQRSVQVKRRS